MRLASNKTCSAFVLMLFVAGSALCAGPTYPNRVWHYPQGGTPYYTIEAATINTATTWDTSGSPYILEADVSIAAGTTLSVAANTDLRFVPVAGLYVNGTINATSATFNTTGTTSDFWKGIYLAPTAGASTFTNCQIGTSGGVGYCSYGCPGMGTYHSAARFAALYIDGCAATVTGCTFSNAYGHAVEIWSGSPTITNNTFTNVGGGYYTIAYDNPDVFPTISGNNGSGTGSIGVGVAAGTTASSGRWTIAGPTMPYLITGHLTIGAGQTLTIDPGVTVKAAPGDTGLRALGVLKAEGTAGSPIVFTSRAATPAAGDWNGIYIGPDAGASRIKNCQVAYAGGVGYCYYGCSGQGIGNGNSKDAAIFVDGSNPEITNNTISRSYGHGVEVWNGAPLIKDNAFSNLPAGSYVVALDTMNTFPVMRGNALAGTGISGVYSPGGETSTGGIWNLAGAGLNWYLGSSLSVANGKTLVIDPGNTVYMPAGNAGVYVSGTLIATGTPSTPVTFTSRAASPAAGDWNGVYLAPTAGASSLQNAHILFSGGIGSCNNGCSGLGTYNGAGRMAGLYVDACNPALTGLILTDTYGNGVEMFNSTAALSGVTIARANQSALKLDGGASPDITNSSFTDSGAGNYWAISIDGACRPNPTNLTITGNKYQGVLVRGGTVAVNTRWKQWSPTTPYVISPSITVAEGATLTIDPSVTVKNWSAGIYVNGTLLADGAAGDITFTSMRDDTVAGDTDPNPAAPTTGEWLGICFGPQAGASVLNKCRIRYCSAYNGGTGLISAHGAARYTAIFIDSCSPAITNCAIQSIYGHGIELWASKATIQNNTFTDIDNSYWSIVQRTTDTFPVYANNAASGTGNIGVWTVNGEIATSGRWYNPGPNLPYYVSNLIQVKDGVTLTVDPGTTMQFVYGMYVYGTLNAQGSATLPITFTSRADSGAGQWQGVYLGPNAGGSTLKWLRLRNGSAFNYSTGLINVHGQGHDCTLMLDTCSPALDNVSITKAAYDGLVLWGSNSAITNSVFTGNGWSGIAVKASSAPTITGVTAAGNDAGIYTNASNFTLLNSIVAFNRLGINSGGTNAPAFRNTDVYGNSGGNFLGVTDPGTANGNIKADPNFLYLAAGNCRIGAGSPCIDTGDDTVNLGTGLDINGQARKQGAHVDMGAWEAPVGNYVGWPDVAKALRIAGGLVKAGTADYARLNVVPDANVDRADAARLCRMVVGLDPNP